MSYSRLVFDVRHPQGAHELAVQVTLLIVQGRPAEGGNGLDPVDRPLVSQADVPRLLDPLGNPVDRPIPGFNLPAVAAGGAALDNEECYLYSKFMRALGVVYLEHQARI